MTFYLSIAVVLLTAIGQLFLKKGAQLNKSLFLNCYVLLGYSIFVIVIFLSISLMRYLPLKYISIIVSFSYPTTVLLAMIVLNEKISRKALLACLIIVSGCIVFNL